MRMLFVFALCCHVVYAGDLHSLLSTYLQRAGCGTAQIVVANRCIHEAFDSMTGSDTCENFGRFSPCWPQCFCDNPEGFDHLVHAFKPQCPKMPPCGAARGAKESKPSVRAQATRVSAYHKILKRHRLLNPTQA